MDLKGKNVLMRTDLNLPLDDEGRPKKTIRFERYLESIRECSKENCKIVLVAHQGRPGRDDFTGLEFHRDLLEQELDRKVYFISSILGNEVEETLDSMDQGDIALLENVRMMSEELKNLDSEEHSEDIFLNNLASKFDLFVNDAFSVAHRSHGSIVGLTQLLESLKGPLMEEEIENLDKVKNEFDSGVLVLGGEKPSDLIGIIESKIDDVEKILLGGVPGELALMTQGHDLNGKEDWIEERGLDEKYEELKRLIDNNREKFELPEDLYNGEENITVDEVEDEVWDIGLRTADRYAEIVREAESVLMKGPPGVFEKHEKGTKRVLEAIKDCEGFTVLGGGHTSSLVNEFGYSIDDFDHVSIAGGAFVKYVSGKDLPGVEALK
jgi:phosphoglycerate kinase